MQGTARHLVNPPVSSREAFAEIDAAKAAQPAVEFGGAQLPPLGDRDARTIGGTDDGLAAAARNLRHVAVSHRRIANDLDNLARRIEDSLV